MIFPLNNTIYLCEEENCPHIRPVYVEDIFFNCFKCPHLKRMKLDGGDSNE